MSKTNLILVSTLLCVCLALSHKRLHSEGSPTVAAVYNSIAIQLEQVYPGEVKCLASQQTSQSAQTSFQDSVRMKSGKVFSIVHQHDSTDYEQWLDKASLFDQMSQPYIKGVQPAKPLVNFEPGRARCQQFFDEMYGATEKQVLSHCTTIRWTDGTPLRLSTVNGVASHAITLVRELQMLPTSFHRFLNHPGGSVAFRLIAGTKRRSMHFYGVAIDINVAYSDYWRNTLSRKSTASMQKLEYRNRIPQEIVDIFERHGFIWGGKWYHYDTMHFEFRPELCTPECNCTH